jgi:DNA-directed RNA polymerase subunit F
MIGKKVLEDRPVTLSEVKDILHSRKEDGELTYEQKITYDYARKFGKSKKINEALESLIAEGVDDKMAIKVINAMPKTADQVKLIFEKARFTLKDSQISKILSVVKDLA